LDRYTYLVTNTDHYSLITTSFNNNMGHNMTLSKVLKQITPSKYIDFLINSVFVTFGALTTLLTIYFMLYMAYILVTL